MMFAQDYVSVANGGLQYRGNEYRFIGTNYWYGPNLPLLKDDSRGIDRLKRELDDLKKLNINNLRVVVGVEGEGKINGNLRVEPVYMSSPNTFHDEVLNGLDVFMDEVAKRDMTVVLALSNNWEWSGGWMQYLNWNGELSDSEMRKVSEWDDLRDKISKFYSCEPCVQQYQEKVKRIVNRKNSVNGKLYTEDKSLMSWQIANEPRPMRPAAVPNFKKFIGSTAALIKSLDKNHLVSIGSEGYIGSENMEVYKEIHTDKNVDYLTIHIWPRNWAWVDRKDFPSTMAKGNKLSLDYIDDHIKVAKELQKPLLIEEFGFPRDEHSFSPKATTKFRDQYYSLIFSKFEESVKNNGPIKGVNFWAFGGEARPIDGQLFWKSGNDFMGDPPFEEQGLYSVFDSDTSTIKLIKKYNKKIK